MKTIARLSILLLLGCLAQPVAGQTETPVVAVDLDHAAFAYDESQSMLEVYVAFGAASLSFQARDEGYLAQLPLKMAMLRSTEATLEGTPRDPVWQDSLTLDFVVPDTVGLDEGGYFVRQARLTVPPGEYELRVTIPGDAGRGRRELELRRDVLVPDFVSNHLVGFSDITLATTIAPSRQRDDLFYKNGLIIRPNANQLFGVGVNTLYYYAEAYNTDAIAADSVTLLAYIAEANRPQPLPGLRKRSQRPARTPDVLVGTFALDSLHSGSYFLRLVLLNEDNEAVAEQSRKFFVFNPGVEREATPEIGLQASFETSPYATMPEEEVDRSYKHLDLIATEQERRRAGSIQDLDERRRFLMEFWQRRDPNPATPHNEFREEFYARLQYANERYSYSRREGWATDRGRVLIRYGAPGQVEPHLYDRDTLPYEIWQYNNIPGEGQAFFIFADRDGFGDFELLHSTVTGERKMQNWEAELRSQF